MSFSATEAAFEGFRIVRRNPMAIVWWGLAYLGAMIVAFGIGGPAIVQLMSVMETMPTSGASSPEDMMPMFQAYGAIMAWALPLGLLFSAVLNAAVVRAVAEPSTKAFGHMRVGMDEVRVIVVSLVLGILFGVLSMVLAVGVGVLAGITSSSGMNALWLLVVAAGIAAFCLIIWLAVRFSLAIPITVVENKFAIFDSFRRTKGRFWGLFGMAVIAFIMSIIVSLLGMIVALPVTMMTGDISGLAQYADVGPMEMLQAAWPVILGWCVVNAFVSALQLAVIYAPFAAAYRDLSGRGDVTV